MGDFLIVRGNTASWAIPSAAVQHVRRADDATAEAAEGAAALLDLDVGGEPRRVLDLASRSGSVPLLVSGALELVRLARTDILELPLLLKTAPAGRLVASVLTDGARAVAWVLDVDALDEVGGDACR